jgi:hypothetical protein
MKKLFTVAAMMIVSTASGLAQNDLSLATCSTPQTTGALQVDGFGPKTLGSVWAGIKMTSPEESWQERARENAERRRRLEAEGCLAD